MKGHDPRRDPPNVGRDEKEGREGGIAIVIATVEKDAAVTKGGKGGNVGEGSLKVGKETGEDEGKC